MTKVYVAGVGMTPFGKFLDRSVSQLSRLIAKTMPEDDPGTCVGPEADRVAQSWNAKPAG